MSITRRSFLARLGAAIVAALAARAPADTTKPRACYVRLGQDVSYVGLNKYPKPSFIGSTLVEEIEPWDGAGYPCRVRSQSYYGGDDPKRRLMPGVFYDHELATLHEIPREVYLREIRAFGDGTGRYNNIHSWVRAQREQEGVRYA